MVPLSRYIAFFSIVCGGCAVDLLVKAKMFAWLGISSQGPSQEPRWNWGSLFFAFQTTLNEGALFGVGHGMWAVFAALSVVAAIAVIVWLFVMGAAHDWWLTIALSLISAGIFGNLYDRLGLPGLVWPAGYPNHTPGETVHAVRDFILMGIGQWRWPNYNIADSMLVGGAAMLVCHAFLVRSDNKAHSLSDVPKESE